MEAKNNSENIEQLLNQAFLDLDFEEPKNQKIMNAVANKYLSPKPIIGWINKGFNQVFLFSIATIALSITVIYSVEIDFSKSPSKSSFMPPVSDTLNEANVKREKVDINQYFEVEKLDIRSIEKLPVSISESLMLTQLPEPEIERFSNSSIAAKEDTVKPYVFPKLNVDDRQKTIEQKEEMLKVLNKVDKAFYQFVTIGEVKSENGEMVKIQDFYMSVGEVSNLEYRTYLFDLLMQGRNEEFLISKPDQANWSKELNSSMSPFEDHYFSHPAYDNYPVVNVTLQGAENYCKWLLEEFLKYDKKKKIKLYEVKIPTLYEWIHAAKGGNEKSPYPWGAPYTRNAKGCFLANFDYLSIDDNCEGCDSSKQKELSVTIENQNLFVGTAPIYSYLPNDFGLYCLSGNAAELVVYPDGSYGTKGGSWRSPSYEIQIDGPERFKGKLGSSVEVGFRPIIRFVKL